MDSESFFGFDASIPIDEDEEGDGDDYDALNDETFGSAAMGGDWEENHKQLSSLTEAERVRRAVGKNVHDFSSGQNDPGFQLNDLHNNEDFRKTLESLSFDTNAEKKRLFERSLGSSPLIDLQKDEISVSPGNSIWSPSVGLNTLENLHQLKKQSHFSNFPQQFQSNRSTPLNIHESVMHSNIHSIFKTVSELEEELKGQHLSNHQRPMTVDELEREISRQAINARKANALPLSASFPSTDLPGSFFPNLSEEQANFQTNAALKHSDYYLQQCSPSSSYPSGNIQQCMQYRVPLSGALHNRAALPPGFVNSANRPTSGFKPHLDPRGLPQNRGFPHELNNLSRINNDYRNHDQNFRFNQSRNLHEHQCDKGGGAPGSRVRRDSDAEWEEWQRIRQMDEYCGLMTPREKSWLRNIQAMQLQTDNPYLDDYYFVMHSMKELRKREEEVVQVNGLELLLAEKGKEGKEYEPPKLENSLGKLQVASVNAPRKIIDLKVMHLDSSHPTTVLQRDMRKHRHLLLHIEKLYNINIELNDLERKIRALPDCPTRDLFRSKCRQLVIKLWSGLTNPHESFVQLLCIRKGKTLAARLLTWVGQEEAEHLLATVAQNLALLTKRDTHDKRLPLFWLVADRFFSASSAATLASFGIMMASQLKPLKSNFVPALSGKLGVSLVLSLLVRGEVLWCELEKDESWRQFLRSVALGLSAMPASSNNADAQPLPSMALASAPSLPSNRLATCFGDSGDLEPETLKRALDHLRAYECHLMKNAAQPPTKLAPGEAPYFANTSDSAQFSASQEDCTFAY